MAKLSDDVLNVIQNHLLVNSEKCEVRIDTQLAPLLFEKVKQVFTLYGARWVGVLAKGTGRHVFIFACHWRCIKSGEPDSPPDPVPHRGPVEPIHGHQLGLLGDVL